MENPKTDYLFTIAPLDVNNWNTANYNNILI